MSIVALIRDARADEAFALDALQRRASDVWEEYRAQLAAHPGAITPPHQAIAERRVRVAVDAAGRRSRSCRRSRDASTHRGSQLRRRDREPERARVLHAARLPNH